jgi:hypothetical protein
MTSGDAEGEGGGGDLGAGGADLWRGFADSSSAGDAGEEMV